jgi:hypothetical protein
MCTDPARSALEMTTKIQEKIPRPPIWNSGGLGVPTNIIVGCGGIDPWRPKAPYFVQPRSETFWNCDQKHCILFSRAAKHFGIANKSTAFCAAAQRKNVELRTKAFILFSRAVKILEFTNKNNNPN